MTNEFIMGLHHCPYLCPIFFMILDNLYNFNHVLVYAQMQLYYLVYISA